MNKVISILFAALLLSGCTLAQNRSMPYDAWRLGFFAPAYMEVWIETADVLDNSGWVFERAGSGFPAMSYPRKANQPIPSVFKGNPKGWPKRVGWGAGKYVKGADLPKEIYVRWQSLVEPQIYHTRIDISDSVREIMRKKETPYCGFTGKIEVDYRKAIVIGLAPGGIAKAWVIGPCLDAIEIARVQAKVDPVGPYNGKSGGKFRPLSPTSKAYVEQVGVPYGSW
jgi:hypothetical protein